MQKSLTQAELQLHHLRQISRVEFVDEVLVGNLGQDLFAVAAQGSAECLVGHAGVVVKFPPAPSDLVGFNQSELAVRSLPFDAVVVGDI